MNRARHERTSNDSTPHCAVQPRHQLFGLAVTCLLSLLPQTCLAQFTPRDAQIIARTLSFSEAATTGPLELGIAFAPDRPASLRQAESLRAAIGDGLAAGKVTLTARLIPLDQLARATGIAGIFVTSDLGPQLDSIAAAARHLHVPTISNEMACVRTAHCVLGFSSQPTVEIVLNHDAANNAGVRFIQAFRMLVHEQ